MTDLEASRGERFALGTRSHTGFVSFGFGVTKLGGLWEETRHGAGDMGNHLLGKPTLFF